MIQVSFSKSSLGPALTPRQRALPPGTVVRLIADDPAVRTDEPAWSAMVGATVLELVAEPAGCFTAVVRLP